MASATANKIRQQAFSLERQPRLTPSSNDVGGPHSGRLLLILYNVSGAVDELDGAARTLNVAFPPPPEATSAAAMLANLISKFRAL